MIFYADNLSSQSVTTGLLPWEFKPTTPISDTVRIDKSLRDSWINNRSTTHYCYTGFEGVNSNQRISRPRSDGSGNPPVKMWALVVDYDASRPNDQVIAAANSCPIKPNYIERTLSGNFRFVWLFEQPIALPSFDFTVHFLKTFHEFGFDLALVFPGFDKPAFTNPTRLYTNSCEWIAVHDKPVPASTTLGWAVQASKTFDWSDTDAVDIPFEVIGPELAKKFPRFTEWPTEFTLGSQGPTFWVDASSSPKSAIVRETGIQTFSANAPKAWYAWPELLGADFCQQYRAASLGRAVSGIYHDGSHYYRLLPNNLWRPFEKNDIASHLRVARGLSVKKDSEGKSVLDEALEYIQSYQAITGAAPFIFQPTGLIRTYGQDVLNISSLKVLSPTEQPVLWGCDDHFPWISYFLDHFFSSPDQLPYFLSWLAYFYRAGYHQSPTPGQNVFIAGPVNAGKTLLNRQIIGGLVGGFKEAQEYLLGQERFGSELFEVPLWVIDDTTTTSSDRNHNYFSAMIKKMAANPDHRYHPKFRIPTAVKWMGRIVITCNADMESIRILPSMDISIREKLMLFKAQEVNRPFPHRAELERTIAAELPFFARYLLDYSIPEQCAGETRYGVSHYHEASLVNTARQASREAGFVEILADWKDTYFNKLEKTVDHWEGTAYQLQKQILLDPTAAPAMHGFGVDSIGRHLTSLVAKGAPVEQLSNGESRIWRIKREKQKQGTN